MRAASRQELQSDKNCDERRAGPTTRGPMDYTFHPILIYSIKSKNRQRNTMIMWYMPGGYVCTYVCILHAGIRSTSTMKIVSNNTSPINNPSLTYLSSFQQFSWHGEGQAPRKPNATWKIACRRWLDPSEHSTTMLQGADLNFKFCAAGPYQQVSSAEWLFDRIVFS